MNNKSFSLRQLLTCPWSWFLVLAVPVIAFAATTVVAEGIYKVPERAPEQACQVADATPAVTAKSMPNGSVVIQITPSPAKAASSPAGQPQPGTDTNTQSAAERCGALIQGAPSSPAVAQARGLAVISFTAADMLGTTLFFYAFMSILRFSVFPLWTIFIWLALAFAISMVTVYVCKRLPHAALIDLFHLLKNIGSNEKEATSLATCGSALEVFVSVLYVFAMVAVAMPDKRQNGQLGQGHNDTLEELSKRFERLTTLSSIASLGFAVGVVTLCALVAWPLSVPGLGKDFADTETPIVALFGLYLTAILAAAYFPAAMILGARADSLADRQAQDVKEKWGSKQDWLTKNGLTATTTPRLITAVGTLLPLIAGTVTSATSASSAVGALVK